MGGNNSKGNENCGKYKEDVNFLGYEVKKYSNEEDNIFKVCEKDLNLLKFMTIQDFQQLIFLTFKSEDYKEEVVDETSFLLFINRKLVKHFLISNDIRVNDQLTTEIKFFYENVYSELFKKYKHYYKKSVDENQKRKASMINNLALLTIGFNYCKFEYAYDKIDFIFNLLSENGRVLKRSHFLRTFLMFVLLVPSNIMIVLVDKLSESFEKYKTSLEIIQKYFSAFEYEDSIRLTDMTLESIFGESQEIDYDNFVKNFKNVDYLLTPEGIRNKLKATNVNN